MDDSAIATLKESASRWGATSTRVIPIEDVCVEDWVLLKCEYGCKMYGKRFTCPPYAPSPDETRKTLSNYKKALLLEFKDLTDRAQWRVIQKSMYELEREAFLLGFYRAFAYTCGACKLCDDCPSDDIEVPTQFDKRKCKNRRSARPSMEACGIDVFQTARNGGYEMRVVHDENGCFDSFCLLLLE